MVARQELGRPCDAIEKIIITRPKSVGVFTQSRPEKDIERRPTVALCNNYDNRCLHLLTALTCRRAQVGCHHFKKLLGQKAGDIELTQSATGLYLLSGALGRTVAGGVGATCGSPPLVEAGMSRQSNEYTKSPFAVFPIGSAV
jgi:hypothetical protein